jgi:hypothetical protein
VIENTENNLHGNIECATNMVDGVPLLADTVNTEAIMAKKRATSTPKSTRKLEKPAGFKEGVFIFPQRESRFDKAVSGFMALCFYRILGEDIEESEISDLLEIIPVLEMPSIGSIAEELGLSNPRMRRTLDGLEIRNEYSSLCREKKALAKAKVKIREKIAESKKKKVVRRRRTTT